MEIDIEAIARKKFLELIVTSSEAILNEESDGWVLVPREPTREMITAMGKQPVEVLSSEDFAFADRSEAYLMWHMAIKSAPTLPADGSGK